MTDFTGAWRAVSLIDGWLSESQGRALFEAARQVEAPNWIVEIGSHLGRSTVILALAARPGVKVHAVDPFDDPRWGGGTGLLRADAETTSQFGVAGSSGADGVVAARLGVVGADR